MRHLKDASEMHPCRLGVVVLKIVQIDYSRGKKCKIAFHLILSYHSKIFEKFKILKNFR